MGIIQGIQIWVPNNTNYYIGSVVNEKYAYVDTCPVALMKAIKNEVELAGMRYSHVSIMVFF